MASSFLQVADLFDAHAAEAPILRLVSVLNAQAAQIRELQETLRLVQNSQRETLVDCKSLHAAVSPLGPRVQNTENEITTLKQFAVATRLQLETISLQLQHKADRQQVKDVDIRAQTALKQLGKELRNEFPSLQLVQCLQTEQSELYRRMETMDNRLTTKMDKSEAARLDGVLVQIHGFRPVVAQLSSQMESIQTQQKKTEFMITQLDSKYEASQMELEEIRHHTEELQQILDTSEDRYHQVIAPPIQRLENQTHSLHLALDELKTAAATSETTLRTLSAKFHSSANAFGTQLQHQRQYFERVLEEKAPRQEVKVLLVDVNRQLAAKAPDSAHRALFVSFKDLQAQYKKLQEHVELSTRFLDWFAHRGEAYEHNLELVDTQLGRLALASHPRSREPFEGRVRFPRSP